LKPLFLLTFPLPVTRNLFAAALLVFIFGTFPPYTLIKNAHLPRWAPTASLRRTIGVRLRSSILARLASEPF
jgi:hypothetical protein